MARKKKEADDLWPADFRVINTIKTPAAIMKEQGAFLARKTDEMLDVEIVQYGAAQEQFNVSHAVDFLVPTPPRDEQLRIERWITERTAIIDGVANRIEGGTNRLTELRTALISAAVTGKIDVRGEAA